jgi:pimeloyl-ACP methyl ester carboxylesterase
MLELTPDSSSDYLRTLLAPVDAEVLTGELAQYLIDAGRAGLAPGSEGWWEDDVALLAPWGFQLDSIRTPVLLLHGRQDRFVPLPMANGSRVTSPASRPSSPTTTGTSL